MINFDVIVVFIVLLFVLISLYKDIVGPAFTFIIAVSVLGIFKILTPSEILGGFANDSIIVILMLLVLANIFRQTSLLDILFDWFFRSTKNYQSFTRRMMLLVSVLSAFLNNTPLVALMMPYVHTYCKQNKVPQSKLLMPLSFAAILGGCATLIGTSTNLIVNGMVKDQTIIVGLEPLSMFEFSYVGVPMIIIGVVYLIVIGQRILPSHASVLEDFSPHSRKYIVEVQVKKKSRLIDKTIEQAKFKSEKGLYLLEIIRKNYSITTITPDTVLKADDILLFAGETIAIAEMVKTNPSLVIPSIGMFSKKKYTEVVEVVLSHNSSLNNKSVSEVNFRRNYDATVIAVHRNGEKISGKLDATELHAGDALLLLAGNEFNDLSKRTLDFYTFSNVKEIKRLGVTRSVVLSGGSSLVILLATLDLFPMFLGLVILLTVVLLLKITTPKDITKSIDYDLALIIALSLSLGTAMIKTGVAEMIANLIISVFIPLGKVGLLSGIYIITSILAAYITNKTAVAIIFPISLTIALNMGFDPVPFILIVSFAAAANFLTPIGYQTNLMVYGPGGYKFTDFFKVGFPLTIIYMIVTVTILRFIYF